MGGEAARVAPLLEVEGLSKVYSVRRGLFGTRRELVLALSGVSLSIRRAETVAVVGESGSGKTTLGRTLLRLVEPTYGRIRLEGRDITRLSERELRPLRRRLQIVFQDPTTSLDPRLTVREIVGEGLELQRLAKGAELRSRVDAELVRVGLDASFAERFPGELSGGQRQRVAIARALAVGPDLLVCDEITSALDPSVQAQVVNLLGELQATRGTSLLFVTHDLALAELVSHRMVVLYFGRVVESAPTQALVSRPLHPYTRALFAASPRMPTGAEAAPARRRLTLHGEPPSHAAPPRGCAFHPRCPKAKPGQCDVETPTPKRLREDPEHEVACFYPGE